MTPGRQVLQWADEHQYRLSWIAEQINYPPESLYEELHTNRISRALADALFKRFGLRVLAVDLPCPQSDSCS